MQFTLGVSLNTSLADLDEALSVLLRRELSETGFGDVGIAFEAPDRQWAAAITQPTLNLFLYDLRENQQRRAARWESREDGTRRLETRPPLWLDASYTLTAWARVVEDEHRMLSQALTTLHRYPELPSEVLPDGLAHALTRLGPLRTRVGNPQQDANADFWTAVGGPYKLSFHYIVTVPFASGAELQRGPPVSSRRLLVDRREASGAGPETHSRDAD